LRGGPQLFLKEFDETLAVLHAQCLRLVVAASEFGLFLEGVDRALSVEFGAAGTGTAAIRA
jgi:hypothetical protein